MKLAIDFQTVADNPQRPVVQQKIVALLKYDFEVVKIFLYSPSVIPDLLSTPVVFQVEVRWSSNDGRDEWAAR